MSTLPSDRRGVVAVIQQHDRFLVIKRSRYVRAPGAYCFPGGWIEPDEEEAAAGRRELREELDVDCQPLRRIWQSTTPWGVRLVWWNVLLAENAAPRPNPAEVESTHWLTAEEMLELPDLLASNRDFLAALAAGEFSLP